MLVPNQESERSCICVLEILMFVTFYDCDVRFRNLSQMPYEITSFCLRLTVLFSYIWQHLVILMLIYFIEIFYRYIYKKHDCYWNNLSNKVINVLTSYIAIIKDSHRKLEYKPPTMYWNQISVNWTDYCGELSIYKS